MGTRSQIGSWIYCANDLARGSVAVLARRGDPCRLSIMARLRDPSGGCPWDLEQDFQTISPHTIEEAYEVDDAIERGDSGRRCCEELGRSALPGRLPGTHRARRSGHLRLRRRSREAISEKLVRRHPHVFASKRVSPRLVARGPSRELGGAQGGRARRKGRRGRRRRDGPLDPFEGIPRRGCLPLRASAKIAGTARTARALSSSSKDRRVRPWDAAEPDPGPARRLGRQSSARVKWLGDTERVGAHRTARPRHRSSRTGFSAWVRARAPRPGSIPSRPCARSDDARDARRARAG